MTYDCMTPDELALWRKGAEQLAKRTGYTTNKPCVDCPLSFRAEEHAAGRCRLPAPVSHSVAEARRAYMREWMSLARARASGNV